MKRLGHIIHRKESGFSLLEMMIALVILGILTTELVRTNALSRDYQNLRENSAHVSVAKTLLLSFLQTNGYLPCPDTDNDGWENRSGDQCSADSGKLPHLMLGVSRQDAWNESLFYKVNTETTSANISSANFSASYFASDSAPVFTFATPPTGVTGGSGNLTVCSESATTSCSGATSSDHLLESAAIAVIVSFGKNSAQTWGYIHSGSLNALNSVETENADDDAYFWQSSMDQADDSLAWITGYESKYALMKSERGLH
ncbi:type II secretion system protein [Thiomicrorhabdus sp. zzn3]|uniref:type II secretion system protein n=1 Tax=Thiomicrorhabdus sp. zzn3 TaxID=3039775 RepID=UPI002436B292|nr:type II secretion system protein [Thiomicrorhabdus sp. zzn3]MDG6778654.1 type II secretion system protein [Thiomicrorhabdus sp. zzn3]